jgi:hypothetical protein
MIGAILGREIYIFTALYSQDPDIFLSTVPLNNIKVVRSTQFNRNKQSSYPLTATCNHLLL